jgi:hypothetical protein
MTRTRISSVAMAAAVAVTAVLALASCQSNAGPSASPVASPSQTSTSTGTSTPRPTGTSTAQPVEGQCDTADLAGSLGQGTGGAAGSVGVTLVLTNNGSEACDLQGWPGVSFVGDGNGTQLGAAADFDRSKPHPTVTLQPGGTAQAPLQIVQARNYDEAQCQPKQADGFRVYPPGSTESLFVRSADYTACQSDSVKLLTVGALVPGE